MWRSVTCGDGLLRGDHYVFDSGEHLCWWARGRHDAPEENYGEWCGADGVSGVQIPWDVADRVVPMRLAELLVDQRADALLTEMATEGGNTGMIQLLGNLDVIRSALRELQSRVRRATVEEVYGDGK